MPKAGPSLVGWPVSQVECWAHFPVQCGAAGQVPGAAEILTIFVKINMERNTSPTAIT